MKTTEDCQDCIWGNIRAEVPMGIPYEDDGNGNPVVRPFSPCSDMSLCQAFVLENHIHGCPYGFLAKIAYDKERK